MMILRHALATAIVLGAVVATNGQGTANRGNARAVTIDVSVSADDRMVSDLGLGNFEVRDDGVPQVIAAFAEETRPIEVTLLIQVTPAGRSALADAVTLVAGALRPDDRLSILTIGKQIRQVAIPAAGAISLPLDDERSTPLYDAMAVALTLTPTTGRRALAVVFSNGEETGSFLHEPFVTDLAEHTDAVIDVIIPARPGTRGGSPSQEWGYVYPAALGRITWATGGSLRVLKPRDAIGDAFVRAIEEARSTYRLSFTPGGVKPGGWHHIEVRVKRKGDYVVRTRSGYFGG